MKILIIRNYPSYMNVQNNTYNIQEIGLAKALIRVGHKCDILFWTDKEEINVTVPVDSIGEISVFYRRGRTLLKNTVYTGCEKLFEQYDILQPCEYNQIQSWILARKYPQKTVIYHGPYYSPFNKRYNLMCKFFDILLLPTYLRFGTKFIVKSEMAKVFLESKNISQDNIKICGVGIDTQLLDRKGEPCNTELYKIISQDTNYVKLLYVGRLEPRRNIPFIFDVFKRVLKYVPIAKLYIVGSGDSKYVNDAFNYAKKLKIDDRIVWQENMEQKYLSDIYKEADFFLLPTEYEIFGMVILEAMYYKTVVLTTENGGSSTLIENNVNGVIIQETNADLWAKNISDIVCNEQKKQAICENAHNTVSDGYTWDALVKEFESQYNSIFDRS